MTCPSCGEELQPARPVRKCLPQHFECPGCKLVFVAYYRNPTLGVCEDPKRHVLGKGATYGESHR